MSKPALCLFFPGLGYFSVISRLFCFLFFKSSLSVSGLYKQARTNKRLIFCIAAQFIGLSQVLDQFILFIYLFFGVFWIPCPKLLMFNAKQAI